MGYRFRLKVRSPVSSRDLSYGRCAFGNLVVGTCGVVGCIGEMTPNPQVELTAKQGCSPPSAEEAALPMLSVALAIADR